MSRLSALRFLLVFSALLIALPLAALEDEVEDALSRADYEASAKARIESVFERAESEDVPAELLLPRLQEGVSKGVAGARVAGVLEGRLDALVHGRRILEDHGVSVREEQNGSRGLWSAAALLLWDGSPEEHLERLTRESRGRRAALKEGFALYASLVEWGLSPAQAVELGVAALSSELEAGDYPGIVRILTEARSERIPIPEVVANLTEELPRVESLSGLRELLMYSDEWGEY